MLQVDMSHLFFFLFFPFSLLELHVWLFLHVGLGKCSSLADTYLSTWMVEVHWLVPVRADRDSADRALPRHQHTTRESSDEIYHKKFFRKAILHIIIIHSACSGARSMLYGNTASCLNARLKDWGFKFLKKTSPHDTSRCPRHDERKKQFSWI